MDAYCLRQERKFRGLYNDVAVITQNSRQVIPYDMNTGFYKNGEYSYWTVLWTKTIWLVYFLIIVFLFAVYFYLKCIK